MMKNARATFLVLLSVMCFATCSSITAQDAPKQDPARQAKIEKALKDLKDKNAGARSGATWALGELKAKECARNIAELLKYEEAGVRGNAVLGLGQLGAKEYADEIGKLINDASAFSTLDEVKREGRQTTVSAEAVRVLKEWGVDVEKINLTNLISPSHGQYMA